MGEALSLADIMKNGPLDQQVGEQWLAAAAILLHQQGDTRAAIAATGVTTVDLSLWNSDDFGPDEYVAYFTVEPNMVGQFTEEVLKSIEDGMHAVVPKQAGLRIESIQTSPAVPAPGVDWREGLRVANGPAPTNQARGVRLEAKHHIEDALHFTNEWERKVYAVLKARQAELPDNDTIGIIPLAAVRVLGHTFEPDLMIAYRGSLGVIEIDGPHHKDRASADKSRERLLKNAGVKYIDRLDVRDSTERPEVEKFVTDFLKHLGR